MKQIPAQLLTTYKRQTRGTCFLIKVVSKRDGTVYPFATLDAVVRFNDGEHNLVYMPNQALTPQNIENTNSTDVDNTELHGWFSEVVEAAVLAGALRSGEITVYRVSFANLAAGAEVVAYGLVGKVQYSANKQGKRKIEFRGLDQLLKTHLNPLYSITCRHDFGDDNCGMPFVWEAAVVAEVEDPFMRFRVTGITRPDDWFLLGVCNVLSGDNLGADLEIETWTTDGWITLSFASPHAMLVATNVRLRQDCDKTAVSCKAYGNIINMGAEHLTPVQDTSLMVPGAYIKSQNAA